MCPATPAPIIAIVGATATGKTAVSLSLAQQLNAVIISCDSQLVYKGMDIGTAKPTVDEQAIAPHYMIDVATPDQRFSAGQYALQARPILEKCLAENQPVILVGGTGFYLKSLLFPGNVPHIAPNDTFRADVLAQAMQANPEDPSVWLHQHLQLQDPNRAAQLNPQEQLRIIRALEIIHHTGQPVPASSTDSPYSVIAVQLDVADRAAHHLKIRQRLDEMVAAGFVEEALSIYQQYGNCYGLNTAHGYRQLAQVGLGQQNLPDAIDEVALLIRQYSKRQRTYFNGLFKHLPQHQTVCIDEQGVEAVVKGCLACL